MKSTLHITIQEREGVVQYEGRKEKVWLDKKPILWGIEKVVQDPRRIKNIEVKIESATFSTVRQIVAAVNTMAWALRVKVNGKPQMKATYDREPNITV